MKAKLKFFNLIALTIIHLNIGCGFDTCEHHSARKDVVDVIGVSEVSTQQVEYVDPINFSPFPGQSRLFIVLNDGKAKADSDSYDAVSFIGTSKWVTKASDECRHLVEVRIDLGNLRKKLSDLNLDLRTLQGSELKQNEEIDVMATLVVGEGRGPEGVNCAKLNIQTAEAKIQFEEFRRQETLVIDRPTYSSLDEVPNFIVKAHVSTAFDETNLGRIEFSSAFKLILSNTSVYDDSGRCI